MNKAKARGVSWVKPEEPSFLKKFKNDVGYKEPVTIDAKHAVMPPVDDDDNGSDRDDELPQVVVLKAGDLTAEEAKKIKDKTPSGQDAKKDGANPDNKIIFKKPAKSSSSDKFMGITASSSKRKIRDEGEKKEKSESKTGKKIKNNSLLSFGGDEED